MAEGATNGHWSSVTKGLLPGRGVYCAANSGAGLPQLVPASWPPQPRQKNARAESGQSEVPAAPAVILQLSGEQVAQAGERQWPVETAEVPSTGISV